MKISSLGYVRVQSPAAQKWLVFGTEVLGLALSHNAAGDEGAVALTNDDRPGRLVVSEGARNRLECAGWELASAEDLVGAVAELQRAGVEVSHADDKDRSKARVRDLVRFTDPAGFTHELFYGQLVEPGSFRPSRPMSGFVTGRQGLGHIVLFVPELQPAIDFYCQVMGFKISDEIDMHGGRAIFFHVNPRHHTLAIACIPGMRGLHHLMLQTASIEDVGTAYDICNDRKISLSLTLGEHTNDRMFSFYVRSPSGFDIEYGWGAETVDDDGQWVVTHMSSPSIWGHKPGDAPAPGCIESVDDYPADQPQ